MIGIIGDRNVGKCCDRMIEDRTRSGRASVKEGLLVMAIDSLGQGLG